MKNCVKPGDRGEKKYDKKTDKMYRAGMYVGGDLMLSRTVVLYSAALTLICSRAKSWFSLSIRVLPTYTHISY